MSPFGSRFFRKTVFLNIFRWDVRKVECPKTTKSVMASVNLKSVSKRFSNKCAAVNNLTLEVKDHEFLVLVGPSGCGKSTTLRLIAGLERSTAGEVWIGSRRVDDVPPRDRDIAMVFQNFALYPNMSVYKNMSFGLTLRNRSGVFSGGVKDVLNRIFNSEKPSGYRTVATDIDKQVRQTAKRLSIEHLLDRKPHQLSGGERQRVALGRAIVREPAAFLLDEPLSNLDAKLRQQMRLELKRLHRDLNVTTIYVTHDQVEAMTLGDRVAVMKDGEILQVGSPLEIYQRPANLFVAEFFGTVPINLCSGTVKQNNDQVEFRSHPSDGSGLDLITQWSNSFVDDQDSSWRQRVFGRDGSVVESQRDVVLGFRAEDVSAIVADTSRGRQMPQKSMPFQFSAVVVEVDRLGESTLIHACPTEISATENLETDSFQKTILVRTEPDSNLKPNDRIEIAVQWEKVFWFDQTTSKNLLKD